MRRNNLWPIAALALASGVVAGFLALSYMRKQSGGTGAQLPTGGTVAVAARDLPLGTVLRAEDLRMITWPDRAVPAGYMASPAMAVGRGLVTAVRTNEPILESKLAQKGAGGGLPVIIPEGMRAVSVRVDEVIGVAGFVQPGTRVDVLLSLNGGSPMVPEAVTRTILQNVQVAAAGQSIQRNEQGQAVTVSVITLLLEPKDAELLTLATQQGRLQLALRNMLDVAEAKTTGARLAALVGSEPAPRLVRARAPTPTGRTQTVVETYKGGVRTLTTFQTGGTR